MSENTNDPNWRSGHAGHQLHYGATAEEAWQHGLGRQAAQDEFDKRYQASWGQSSISSGVSTPSGVPISVGYYASESSPRLSSNADGGGGLIILAVVFGIFSLGLWLGQWENLVVVSFLLMAACGLFVPLASLLMVGFLPAALNTTFLATVGQTGSETTWSGAALLVTLFIGLAIMGWVELLLSNYNNNLADRRYVARKYVILTIIFAASVWICAQAGAAAQRLAPHPSPTTFITYVATNYWPAFLAWGVLTGVMAWRTLTLKRVAPPHGLLSITYEILTLPIKLAPFIMSALLYLSGL